MAVGTITQLALDPHTTQGVAMTLGDVKMTVSTVVGDSSYPTGGTALTGAQLGLPTGVLAYAEVVGMSGSASNNGAIDASFNNATGKLQMWASSGTSPVGLVEVSNGVNLSGVTVTIKAFGY
jgi:hypothetical protein